ncbi:MAG: hypothetical protein LBM02_09190 [Lachnospiraceae bacterium]|jgi:hypothetical protein|nr:hypothetical protein [Lachnospiraceae bacterium]
MTKERRNKRVAIVVLLVLVMGLTVAFSLYETALKINATGTVNGSADWDLEMTKGAFYDYDFQAGSTTVYNTGADNSSAVSIAGDGIHSHANEGITMSGLSFTLSKPGDSVSYRFTVKNYSLNYAAKLSKDPIFDMGSDNKGKDNKTALIIPTLKVVSGGGTDYRSGTDVAAADTIGKATGNTGSVTPSTVDMELTFTYNPAITSSNALDDEITLTNLGVTLKYEQVV